MAEQGVHDVSFSGDVNSTPVVTLLNGIAQGTDENERIARKIFMRGVWVKMHVTNENAVADRLSRMRVLVVKDRQSNGSTLTTTDVLTAATLIAFPLYDREERFDVLVDEVVPLNTFGGSATGTDAYHWYWEKYVPLMCEVHYSGTGSAASDIVKGGLWLIYFGPDAASATDFDQSGASRLLYWDY